MNNKENVYIRKISDRKYEIITKDLYLNSGVYTIYNLDDLIILKLISKKDYEIKENKTENIEKNGEKKIEQKIIESEKLINELNKKGYIVVESEMLAKTISNILSKEIKEKKYIGIKSFDKKFYILKMPYFIKLKKRILGLLKTKPDTIKRIHEITNEPIDALKGAAEIIKESGLIFEERGGKLKLIED